MTDYIKLSKADFVTKKGGQTKGIAPSLHIKHNGLICFNRAAVQHLSLYDENKKEYSGVTFCTEKSSRNCFAVMRDDAGWKLRSAVCGQMIFNNVSLAKYILDATLQRSPCAVGVVKPESLTFKIATQSVDDDKNKDVFALIRKKE
jgi:hypothetical protein